MGWFSDPESTGQRTARMRGENAHRQHQNARDRDDINYQRQQESDYQRQNWQHKTLAFDAEQRAAAREGRPARFLTPAMVPDMPRPYMEEPEYVAPLRSSGGIPWLGVVAIGCILVFFVIPAIIAMLMPVLKVVLQMLGTLLLVAAVGLTVTWLIMHFTAKDDPAKIHRARLFNPIRVARVLWKFGVELAAARRSRKKAGE